MRALLIALVALATGAPAARAVLGTEGFRAVGVAHAPNPISAAAVAPDGRLFAAVQALERMEDDEPVTAEIRVYAAYATNDGSVLDRGTVWATVEDVRATTGEEGLLGLALAPDFATSKLVYVYVTTTDEEVNQHVRVYRETEVGTGTYVGTVLRTLEPPDESSTRNGGALGFGADGCLYLGVGDNNSRWNAQVLAGIDPIFSEEAGELCEDVCLGTAEYPDRSVEHDDSPNWAGKLLRLAVDAGSDADATVVGGGLRNPTGVAVHPLTGQLFFSERGDIQEAEVNVATPTGNYGWPCLEGSLIGSSSLAACLTGHVADEVYANHPAWNAPVAVHSGSPFPVPTGLNAYTGLAYPAEFYGDLFYLLRDSARIYRLDLEPPCFLPDADDMEPIAFHDETNDGDFVVTYDVDEDDDLDNVSLTNLVALVQAKDPLGRDVLYVIGKQGSSSSLTEDSVVFRIEYATVFTPYDGPMGRVAESCYAQHEWPNPFEQPRCLPPGSGCDGQPDGTSCSDGDPCNGDEACDDGICRLGTPPPDGTSCGTAEPCREAPTCQAEVCTQGAPVADGTPCSDGDACNGVESCAAAACVPGAGPAALTVKAVVAKRATLAVNAEIAPAGPMAPESTDDVAFDLRDDGGVIASALLEHPASDGGWRPPRGPSSHLYRDPSGSQAGVTLVSMRPRRSGAVGVKLRAKGLDLATLDQPAVTARLRVGGQCFTANAGCAPKGRATRCR